MEDLIRYLIRFLDPNRAHRGSIKLWQETGEAYLFEIAHPWTQHGCDRLAVLEVRTAVDTMEPVGRWSIRLDHAQYMVVSTPVAGAFRIVVSFESPVDAVHYRLLTS